MKNPIFVALMCKQGVTSLVAGPHRLLWVLLMFCVAPIALAQEALKPEYVLVIVPVAWSGSMADFDQVAHEQAEFFIERSEIDRYANVRIALVHENLTGVSLGDDNLPSLVMRFALRRESGDRYIGLTDGDLVLDGRRSVVGWTQLGGMAVVCEAPHMVVTAHELGHTYNLCDEYNYTYWERQDRALRGCPNPYPPDCPRIPGEEVICRGWPAEDGSPSIMGPAIGPDQKYNQASLDHLRLVFEETFGTPAGPTPTLPPGVTPSPTASPSPTPTPTPTPLPRTILVSSDDAGSTNLYLVETDGGDSTRITTGMGPDVHGAWSPDGEQLVYASATGGALSLYRLPISSGRPELLISGGLNTHPVWSPDGARIAFASDRDGDWDVYTIHPDGSGLENLTQSAADEDWPAWSTDGSRLALASDATGDWEIYHYAYDGVHNVLVGAPVQLTNSPGKDTMPAWSPNGQELAFVSERDGFLQIYVMPTSADELARATLNQYSDWAPSWLDADTILFQSFRAGSMGIYEVHLSHRTEVPLCIELKNVFWPALRSR